MTNSGSLAYHGVLLVVVELRKVVFTRTSQIVLLCTVALGLLVSAGLMVVGGRETGRIDLSGPMVSLSLAVAIGAPLIGALIMTSDWQSREVMTLFLCEPRRKRVFAGKVAATVVLATSAVAAVIFLSVILALAAALALGLPIVYSNALPEIIPLLVGCLVGAISGAAIASAIMSTPLAIVAVITQTVLIDPLLSFGPLSWGAYVAPSSLSEYLDGDARPGPAIGAFAIWVLLPLAIGLWRTCRREIQ